MTLSFTIFSGQKNYNRAHMLFQVLCGFEPIFYTTHPNEEPFFCIFLLHKFLLSVILVLVTIPTSLAIPERIHAP